MPKVFTSKSQKIGEQGEQIACRYLEKHGYSILERNYTKKWGELDIVAKKGGRVHLIEVKSKNTNFAFEDSHKGADLYRPEENMSAQKIARLRRAVQSYLLERHIKTEWQFDLAVVSMDNAKRIARVKLLEDIII